MIDLRKIGESIVSHATRWGRRIAAFVRTRRARRIGTWVFAVIVLLGIVTYFAVPMVLHNILVGQVAKQLKRPVSVGRIGFNLYTTAARHRQVAYRRARWRATFCRCRPHPCEGGMDLAVSPCAGGQGSLDHQALDSRGAGGRAALQLFRSARIAEPATSAERETPRQTACASRYRTSA